MKYTNYELADFIGDEYFKSWVVQPDEDSDFFWESFLKHNPERVSELLEAKEIILSLSFNEKQVIPLQTAEKDEMWQIILSDKRIDRLNFFDENIRKPALWFSLNPISRVAAVLLITFFHQFDVGKNESA